MPRHLLNNQELIELDDVKEFLNSCKTKKERALIVFLWVFGARVTEIMLLRRKHITLLDTDIHVNLNILKKRNTAVKSSHICIIPRDTLFINIFLDYIKNFEDEDYIFPGRDNGHMRRQIVRRFVSRLRYGLYPHFFRHNRANRFAELGKAANFLKNWFGWCDLRPAKNYLPARPVRADKIL